MGISNLKKLIGPSGVTKKLDEYRGKRVGVDISIWLYRFIYRDEPNAVTEGLLKQVKKMHHHQITPVYVFDGKASSDVKIEIERRNMRRQKVNDNIDTLSVQLTETLEGLGDIEAAAATAIILQEDIDVIGNVLPGMYEVADVPQFIVDSDDEGTVPMEIDSDVQTDADMRQRVVDLKSRISTLQKQTRRPSKEVMDGCKELLTILGVPFIQSDGESDVTLAELIASGLVDAVMSEDTDMLPYGCHTFITGFSDSSDTVVEFKLERVLQDLGLTQEQFIDGCILCGCDYADKIYKIGVKKGFELIKKHKTIEKILDFISSSPSLKARHTYPADYLIGVNIARSMFLTRSPGTDPDAVLGRTMSELVSLRGSVSSPYVWRFDTASKERLTQFLEANDINQRYWPGYCKMCEDWRNQRSISEFFAKPQPKN